MERSNIPPFYIGQEVECIEGYQWNGVSYTKGQRFTVLDVRQACKCVPWVIDIGLQFAKQGRNTNYCSGCGFMFTAARPYPPARHFRAIMPAMQAVTFKALNQLHPVSQN